jgi:DNA-binding NarL/FixJ family response regulator
MIENRPRASRALIVDDHPIITDALGAALLSLHVFDGVDKESSISAAEARLRSADSYDLVLLDLHLTDTSGVEAMLLLRERFPELPVIIFSGDDSSETVAAAFEHGVQGYIPKNSPMTLVISAIRMVLSGGNYIPPQAARVLGFETRAMPPVTQVQAAPSEGLSPRQRQVLHYLLQGLPNKVIGARLGMADGTVKSHLNSVYRAFRVNSRAQLILKARESGLV